MQRTTGDTLTLKIRGMDCAEEVRALKQELIPLVKEESLFFDLLNQKLMINQPSIDTQVVLERIKRTGMTAIVVEEKGQKINVPQDASAQEFFAIHGKTIVTVLSGICLIFGLIGHWIAHPDIFDVVFGSLDSTNNPSAEHILPKISIFFYVLAALSGGLYIFPKAYYSAKRLSPDMNLLMVIAVIGAIGIGEWFEAATVAFLFSTSLLMESWSVDRARKATQALLNLVPNEVIVLKPDQKEVLVQVEEVKAHEIFLVRSGERIPLDGKVLRGSSEVNEAPMTGESALVEKQAGDKVFAGTINGNGALEVECTQTSENTTLANIIKLVREAQLKRAFSEQWVEQFAKVYTPAILLIAMGLLLIPPLFFGGIWSDWIYRALVLLVIACPCALVISTPVTIIAAITSCARNGVLVKGGRYMEVPAQIKAVAFDKTGTLTKGQLEVSEILAFDQHTERELLEIIASIESRSEHPIAKAILNYAQKSNIQPQAVEDYQNVQGKGAFAKLRGQTYWLGSHRYLEQWGKNHETKEIHEKLEQLSSEGHSVLAVGNVKHICGLIALKDSIRPEASKLVKDLHQSGIQHIAMLTGDNYGTAKFIAQKLNLDEFHANLLPQDKVNKIEDLVAKYGKVLMVGDGVNDAPALARASIGMSMGMAGSDSAIETSDIALMKDDLTRIPWLIAQSKKTLSIIRQNIVFSLSLKLLFLALAFLGKASLWSAIMADMGASFLVIFNGLRLLKNVKTEAPMVTHASCCSHH